MKSRLSNIFLSRFVIIATASANAANNTHAVDKAPGVESDKVGGLRAGRLTTMVLDNVDGMEILLQNSPGPSVMDTSLSYKLYFGGKDGCADEDSYAGPGTTTKFLAMEDEFGSFCETNEIFVSENQTSTVYTKLVLKDCHFDDPTNGQLVFMGGYDCDSDTCEKCSDDAEINGYFNLTTYVNEAVPYMPMYQCFGIYTTNLNLADGIMDGLSIANLNNTNTTVHQRFDANASEAAITKYWQLVKDHSCISSASAGGGDSSSVEKIPNGSKSSTCTDDSSFQYVYTNKNGKQTIHVEGCEFVADKPKKRCRKTMSDNIEVRDRCPATCNACPESSADLVATWYKPHYECGEQLDSDPKSAAMFINDQLDQNIDFFGLSEWMGSSNLDGTSNTIGDPNTYGVIGSVCGYAEPRYQVPAALFYNTDNWSLVESLPKRSLGCNEVPIPDQPFVQGNSTPSYSGKFDQSVCGNIVVPEGAAESGDDDNCCMCSFSKEEYDTAKNSSYPGLGQRAFVAGLFNSKVDNDKQVCVVAGEVSHPLQTQKLWNINGEYAGEDKSTVITYICTTGTGLGYCTPNLSNSSYIYGTETLISNVTSLCGSAPIVMLLDTNMALGVWDTGSMFYGAPSFNTLTSWPDDSFTAPYACCNDTAAPAPALNNIFASDRISVSKDQLRIDRLEGGSVAPGGPLQDGLQYQCKSNEEHAPLRAHISFRT